MNLRAASNARCLSCFELELLGEDLVRTCLLNLLDTPPATLSLFKSIR